MAKLPDGYSHGYLFNIASGKQVDIFGEREGLKRKRWFIFKEPDFLYKRRIVDAAWQSRIKNKAPSE